MEKRLYRKGHYIEWRKTKSLTENKISTAKSNKENFRIASLSKEESPLIASATSRQDGSSKIHRSIISIKSNDKKEPKYTVLKQFKAVEDSVKKQMLGSEERVRRLSKKSYVLGIVTLISTILFFFYIFTVPTALICGILAIKRGKEAVRQMGNDSELNSKYRSKARNGIRLGMSFFFFLITLLFLGLLAGVVAGALVLDIYLELVLYFDYGVVVAVVIGLIAAYLVVRTYISTVTKIHNNTIPTEQAPQ